MALTTKDAITTLLAAGTIAVFTIQARGVDTTFISSPRWAAAIVFLLGIGMCIVGGDYTLAGSNWGLAMGILGGVATLSSLAGLLFNSPLYVEIAIGIILFMWATTTVRHALD